MKILSSVIDVLSLGTLPKTSEDEQICIFGCKFKIFKLQQIICAKNICGQSVYWFRKTYIQETCAAR